jgi:mannose-1-phosphate guanylyltransferase/mannose-6-phosphate isomerase
MTNPNGRIVPVLLSGGSGSRLWPLSRESYPKQLLPLFGEHTLLQQVALRVSDRELFDPLLVIASEEHRFVIAEQLRTIGIDRPQVILEPCGRDTAPAAAVAALQVALTNPDALILLSPADHLIRDHDSFKEHVLRASLAARSGQIVLFGIKPSMPATRYGYINAGPASGSNDDTCEVAAFTEKPSLEGAKAFIESERYYWNSGIVLVTARILIREFEAFAPDILSTCREATRAMTNGFDFVRLDPARFFECPSISLDYAVLEKTRSASVLPSFFDWSDVGSWSAVYDAEPKSEIGNVVSGDVELEATRDCYVHSEGPLVAAVGIENAIIVAMPDAVLVASKDHDQDVKTIVGRLNARNHSAGRQNLKVHRPWGFFQRIHEGDRFQVKRITVNPGAKLSLQKHYHRAEHWVVVNGTAIVERDDMRTLLRENESIFIPLGAVHRLENPGKVPLNLIEVQSGPYLGEDDIVRFEDVYART